MITFDAVTVRYPDGTQLGPFTFDIGPGVTHLVGDNGAGKSTALEVLTTALPRHSGEITVNGRDPETHAEVRAMLGYVPAKPALPGFLTVDESWSFMARLRGAPRWNGVALRDRLGLPGDVRLNQTSTGMRRKAELLAALAGDPLFLLLDETLANLDSAILPVVLEEVRARPTVVIVHHGQLPDGLQATATISLPATRRSGA